MIRCCDLRLRATYNPEKKIRGQEVHNNTEAWFEGSVGVVCRGYSVDTNLGCGD